jgi:hypothetical protein
MNRHHGANQQANQQFNQARQMAQQNQDRARHMAQQNAARFQNDVNRANQAYYAQRERAARNWPATGQGSGSTGRVVLIVVGAVIVGFMVLIGFGTLLSWLVVKSIPGQ